MAINRKMTKEENTRHVRYNSVHEEGGWEITSDLRDEISPP